MNPNSAISLSKTYSDLLLKAEEDRAFLLAHIESIPKEKIDTLLENANRDINYFRLRVQHVSAGIQAPRIPSVLPVVMDVCNPPGNTPGEAVDVKPGLNVVLDTPVSSSPDSSDNVWWLLGGVVAGLVAVPFVANWVSRDPEKNLATMQDVLKIVKMTSGYGRDAP